MEDCYLSRIVDLTLGFFGTFLPNFCDNFQIDLCCFINNINIVSRRKMLLRIWFIKWQRLKDCLFSLVKSFQIYWESTKPLCTKRSQIFNWKLMANWTFFRTNWIFHRSNRNNFWVKWKILIGIRQKHSKKTKLSIQEKILIWEQWMDNNSAAQYEKL